jgi:ADP-sugar diphosphatase
MSSIFMHTSGLPDSQSHQSCALREYHDGAFKQRIQVSLPANLTTEEFAKLLPGVRQYTPAYGFPALKNWFWRLYQNLQLQDDETHPFNKHPYKLRKLEIQAVDWFWRDRPDQEDKLGFMKLQAKIETDPYLHEGEAEERADWLPGAVFLRGGSVAILVSLTFEFHHPRNR